MQIVKVLITLFFLFSPTPTSLLPLSYKTFPPAPWPQTSTLMN